jgi:hypothetical protein
MAKTRHKRNQTIEKPSFVNAVICGRPISNADTEDNLQKAAHKLNRLITEYSLTISVQKTKSVAFKRRDPVRTKIVIDNKIIEHVKSFNCLGNMIFYERELDIDNKLNNYLKITGILNNVFRPQKALKKTSIKLCNTLALPVLL